MRVVMHLIQLYTLPAILLGASSIASQLPDQQPFHTAITLPPPDDLPIAQPTQTQHELLKRQTITTTANGCPTSFNNCANLGAANLCCAPNAVCSADFAGHVACCPSGAACSGTIGGVITAGTVNSDGAIVGAATTDSTSVATGSTSVATTATATTTTTTFQSASSNSNGLVVASTTLATGTGFVLDGTSTVATPGAAVRGAQMVSHVLGSMRRPGVADMKIVVAIARQSSFETVGVPAHLSSCDVLFCLAYYAFRAGVLRKRFCTGSDYRNTG